MRDSTIAGNDSIGYLGAGLSVSPSSSNQVDSFVTLTNTILAGNTAVLSTTGNDVPTDCGSGQGIIDGGHNLIGVLDGCAGITAGVNGDQGGTEASPLDPGLGQLANNGGPTQTLALLAGSPAIGAGDPADCQATPVSNNDQRGRSRNAATRAACDIGAYDTGGN